MRLLVTGGLGYVGAFAARHLAALGHDVTLLDNLSTGHRGAGGALPLVVGDCRDEATVEGLLRHRRIEGVLHFAGLSEVGASVKDPAAYYAVNVGGAAALLSAMRRAGVTRLVFSSSAAVYGQPDRQPIPESAPLAPINPYGRSKAMVERLLEDAAAAGQVRAACLRYFNAAGASAAGDLGEDHRPESHLIPRVIRAALEDGTVPIYGTDYPTPDGTAVRDYIHVEDLASAHALALGALDSNAFFVMNLGTGTGHSVEAVIQAAEKVAGKKIKREVGARRAGDPAVLVSSRGMNPAMAAWTTEQSSLHHIVSTAFKWHSNNKQRTTS